MNKGMYYGILGTMWISGLGIGAANADFIYERLGVRNVHVVTKDVLIEDGFAQPSGLEKVTIKDNDNNGVDEVYMTYDNREYLFLVNEEGIPELQPYDLKIESR